MKKPFKLLCWFDYNSKTGFATVSHNILQRLKKHFGERLYMDIVAINYITNDADGKPQPGKHYAEDNGHTAIHPAISSEGSFEVDPLGRHGFLSLLGKYEYDGIFIIQDPGVLYEVMPTIKEFKKIKKENNQKQFKSIVYFPIDGGTLKEWFTDFDMFDTIVAYTEYGRAEVLEMNPSLKGKIKVIPHGIDPSKFYPLPQNEKIKFREEYFGENDFKTIFANINRNQSRKDIPTTIIAFEQYLKQYNPKSFLYLHMHPTDPQGWDLRKVIKQTSLKEDIDFMFMKDDIHKIDTAYLNKIYNACDFYLTTTTGEGWGLTVTDSMATRLPVIAPSNTSLIEICGDGDRAWMLENYRCYCSIFDCMIRYQVNDELAAEVMNEAVINKEATDNKVENAYNYSQSLDWDIVCEKWIKIFDKYF